MEEAVLKFKALQGFIPFLEKFLVTIKIQADTNEEFAKKYDKAEQLLGILRSFKSNYTINFLDKIGGVLEGLVNIYSRKKTSAQIIKLEKLESGDQIKMENDYQSPESPPMYQEFKNEREPITIPTERRDSNSYYYDTKPSTSRIDDHKRHHGERRYRDKSRSPSRSRSPSYERRDRKRYRFSRSRSRSRSRDRDRKRSRSRERRRERSRSPSYRRRSPSYQRRSKSPNHRHRSDRRDDRKYDRDRDRDYHSSEYGRNIDFKRNLKVENDLDYKRESKWHTGSNIKQEESYRREVRDEPPLVRYPNPLSRFAPSTSTSTSNRFNSDNIKHEFDRDADRHQNRPKPHPISSRFAGRPSKVETDDLSRKITNKDIVDLDQYTRSYLGVNEANEKFAKDFETLKEIDKMRENLTEYTNKTLKLDIISQLDLVGAFDDEEDAAPISNSPQAEPNIQENIQNDAHNDSHNEFSNEIRNEFHDEIRNEFRANQNNRNERPSVDSRIENRTDSRIDKRFDNQTFNHTNIRDEGQRPPVSNLSSTISASIPMPVPAPTPIAPRNSIENRAEERIALSDKYQRRKRNSNSGAESNLSPQLNDRNASQQLQQDPRLRNRPNTCTITSGASLTEQFMSYGNPQPTPQQHLPPFGPNFNRNHSQNADVCPPQQQRPFFNEQFHPHQQPHPHLHHPNLAQSRPGQHINSPSNNFSPNIAVQPHPRMNPFAQNSNMNQHQHQQNNYHHQENRQRETYADHKRRMEEQRRLEQLERAQEEKRRKAAASVSSTTTQNTANEQSKESNQESSTQSPNQNDSTPHKDVDKEKTSSSFAKKPHNNKVDNAFRNNNWEALPQSKAAAFKIPKLNKSISNTSTTSLDDKRDSPENNVSTSTKATKVSKPSSDSDRRDPRLNSKKTPESSKNRKSSSGSKKVDSKKSSEKQLPENDQIHADTTILMEPEQVQEEPVNESERQQEASKDIPEHVLKLLQNYTDPDKFDQIKSLLVKEAQPNDDAVTSSTQLAQGNVQSNLSNKSKANQSKTDTVKTAKKPKKPYLNELERLNADIRENIPDVLNATGRRTCTLNAQKSNENSPAKITKSAEKPKASGHKSDDETQCDNDKPKRIARRRNTTIDARPLVFDDDDDTPSENTEVQPLRKRIISRRDTVCEQTLNRLVDSDEESEEPIKSKPGPKSTKKDPKPTETIEDQTLAANLPKCTVVLETVNVKEMQRITRSSKRKAEQLNLGEENEVTEKEIPVEEDQSSSESKRQKVEIKNIDKTITTKSKSCQICDKNVAQGISSHYANMHEGHEVYSARMSVKNSDKIRRNPPKDATYANSKFTAYCYYCEKDVTNDRTKWITHFIRHTGEFTRSCTKCQIKLPSNNDKNDFCVHSEKISPLIEFGDTIFVYMCNLCNWTQYQEENMKNHIRNTHEINLNVTSQYMKINLIPNFVGVKGRTGRRLPSVAVSETETESVANSEEMANQDVFKSSNQDDDVLSDTFKQLKENTFDNLHTAKPKSTITSIADRLTKRFKQQEQIPPVVKEEATDAHEIVYRCPDELTANKVTTPKKPTRPNPLVDGSVIEDGCQIEVNKTEANTSGNQLNDMDDADDWESCSDENDDEDEDISPSKSLNNSLSRLIMNKLKTNKGRVRTKKRGDKSILSTLKKEKPDDIIDLDKIKTEKTQDTPIRPVKFGQKRVDNIAYSEGLGQQKYNCFIGNCDFLSVNNDKSLSNHLRNKHATERWTGHCYECNKQVMSLGKNSLMKEFEHMMEFHVPNNNPPQQPPPSKPIIRAPEPPKPPVEPPKPAEPVRPMIRIRRLSGDKLSGAKLTQNAKNTIVEPPQQMLTISSYGSIPMSQHVMGTSDEMASDCDNHLKPWTKCMNTKNAAAEMKMKRHFSLVALFKCMANDCIFTTSDKDKMLEHLYNHEDFITQQASYGKSHNIQDHSSWLECCYCEEIPGSCGTLVDHIISEHATSIFQCPYCFYRSVDQHNVGSHLRQYHSQQDEMYILVCGTETKGLTNEIADIMRAQTNRVKVLQCPVTECNESFVHLLDLNLHSRNVHSDKIAYKCPICPNVLRKSPNGGDVDPKHLHEHGFSLCHCAYCPYDCTDISSMHNHLRDEHPIKLPYSFVRIPNGSPNTRQQPTIAYFDGNDTLTQGLVCLPWTEAQLNFMDPSLSEYALNASDPPNDNDDEPSKVAVDKAQFNSAQKVDEFETNEARKQYYIKTVDALFTVDKPPTGLVIDFVRPSTSANVMPNNSNSNTNENFVSTEYDDFVQNEIDSAANILLNETGVKYNELYRCGSENCTWIKSDEREYLMHLSQHQRDGSKVYNCFHCRTSFQTPVDLKNHIKEHLQHRFFCIYCNMTTSTQHAMDHHFETSHRDQDTHYLPLNPLKYDLATDIFVVCPRNTQAINDFITRLVNRVSERRAAKTSYMPEELDSLPKHHILNNPISCGRCGFSNLVRANLVRHFKNGCTEQQASALFAPVNPVPCLNSNERHFDKMRNLAASSNSSNIESGPGKYVPEGKRYVCGAKSCKYQTVSADMLQQHIVTLHESEKCFICPHCSEDLSNSTTATEILNHLRFHDSKIFKCPNCLFIHYLKIHVEKHITEIHPNSKDRAITLERPIKKVEPVKQPNKSITYKWSCNICSKIFNTRALVRAHLSETHRLSSQFKCEICSYSSDTKTAIKEHLAAEHRENDITKIKSHFDRVESEADNTPIWRRDDPTRIEKM